LVGDIPKTLTTKNVLNRSITKENPMELKDLIHQLQENLDEAGTFLDAGDEEETKVYLRAAKELLEDELEE